jgi:hypothetical protein
MITSHPNWVEFYINCDFSASNFAGLLPGGNSKHGGSAGRIKPIDFAIAVQIPIAVDIPFAQTSNQGRSPRWTSRSVALYRFVLHLGVSGNHRIVER